MNEFSDTQRLNFLEKNERGVYPSYVERKRYLTDGSRPGIETYLEFYGWCVGANWEEKPTIREAIDGLMNMSKIKTRKVVINTRPGGFNLSDECIRKYLTKKNISFTENHDYPLLTIFETKDGVFSDSFLHLKRDDEVLIETIEELGLELAGGEYTELKIVEIPADVEWCLGMGEQGSEWIYEKHRTWE